MDVSVLDLGGRPRFRACISEADFHIFLLVSDLFKEHFSMFGNIQSISLMWCFFKMKCSWQYGTTNCIELDKQDKQYALGLNLIRRYKVSWTCILIITILSCIIPYLLKKLVVNLLIWTVFLIMNTIFNGEGVLYYNENSGKCTVRHAHCQIDHYAWIKSVGSCTGKLPERK